MLTKHFDKTIFITNERQIDQGDLSFLAEIGVDVQLVINEGYDFGMWYKALNTIDINKCEQIAFVNDSCILFKDLDIVMQFMNSNLYDYCGITDSNQISYHLQSYFIVVNGRRCIDMVYEYYLLNNIIKTNDVRDIINIYEIGLPDFLAKKGFKIGSMFKYTDYPTSPNICLMNAMDIIDKGCPMIKRKLIYKTFREHEKSFLVHHRFDFNFDYITQIKNIIYPYNINLEYLLDNSIFIR